jgi:predicted RecA/RadA family phage recombinase
MAKTQLATKTPFTFTAPAALVAGQGLLVGVLFGVVGAAASSGAKASMDIEGVFTLPKATGALTLCQLLYWDDTAKNVTATVGTNTKIGVAALAAQSGDATVPVLLMGQV